MLKNFRLKTSHWPIVCCPIRIKNDRSIKLVTRLVNFKKLLDLVSQHFSDEKILHIKKLFRYYHDHINE